MENKKALEVLTGALKNAEFRLEKGYDMMSHGVMDEVCEEIKSLKHAISLLEAEESRKCTVTTNTDRTVIPRRYYVVGQWYKGKESGIISWEREEPEPLNFSTIIRMRNSIAESQGYDMVIITNIIPLEAEEAAEKLKEQNI